MSCAGGKRVRVATSDNLEQLIILGHGAVRVSAKSFHDEVMQTQQEIERVLAQNNQKKQIERFRRHASGMPPDFLRLQRRKKSIGSDMDA